MSAGGFDRPVPVVRLGDERQGQGQGQDQGLRGGLQGHAPAGQGRLPARVFVRPCVMPSTCTSCAFTGAIACPVFCYESQEFHF